MARPQKADYVLAHLRPRVAPTLPHLATRKATSCMQLGRSSASSIDRVVERAPGAAAIPPLSRNLGKHEILSVSTRLEPYRLLLRTWSAATRSHNTNVATMNRFVQPTTVPPDPDACSAMIES